jgi:hypothetical protein
MTTVSDRELKKRIPTQTRTRTDLLQDALTKMSEADLTSRIVIPLLKSMGYHTVTYHGGPDEQGKDVIAWGENELGEIYLGVCQVKRFKPSRKAADTRSFSEVVTQLSQAAEQSVPHMNGHTYRPTKIYFITPYTIDTRVLESRFEGFQAISHRVSIVAIINLTHPDTSDSIRA